MDAFDTQYLRVNKLLLFFAGLWPIQSSFNQNIIFCCIILCILITIFFPQVAYLFKHAKSLDDLYDVLPTFAGGCICLMKPIGLHCQLKKFKVLIQHVNCDWSLLANDEDIRILMEYVERSRMFTLAYLIFLGTGATSYVTAPITIPIFDIILSSNVTRPKRLPHPSEFFIDLEKYYYILLAITYVGYVACCVVVIAIDTIYVTVLQHACGMIAILSYRLENLAAHDQSICIDYNPISNWEKDVKDMTQCIRLQIRIERLIQLIDSTFEVCLITEIGFGVLFQCSACVMIVTHMNAVQMMRNGPLLLLQTFRIFLNSWIGQKIIDHSSQIPVAAYNGMWYQTSLETKKMLLFLITKCRKPYCITMAKLYVISLEGYSMLMRTSASYVTLMLSLNSDEM